MRYLKFMLISLLVFFSVLTVIGLCMPSTVTVGRSVEINAPADIIRMYTNDLQNWRYWLNGADTAYFEKLSAGTNEKHSKIKLGSYVISVITNDSKYMITLWQDSYGGEQINRIEMYKGSGNGTIVNWSFTQQLHWYPWERLGAMLHDQILGPSMEVSLHKLKQVTEKHGSYQP